jgi:hypothetical protein
VPKVKEKEHLETECSQFNLSCSQQGWHSDLLDTPQFSQYSFQQACFSGYRKSEEQEHLHLNHCNQVDLRPTLPIDKLRSELHYENW